MGVVMLLLAWVGGLVLAWLLFADVLERQFNPNRDLVVAPGAAAELTLRRSRGGHYLAPGTINGSPALFLVDTGATLVSVPAHLGPALGLAPGARAQVRTANGIVTVRQTEIDELAIGPFLLRGVRAHLNPGMRGDEVLLGMSALGRFEFIHRQDGLTLRPATPAGG